MEIARNDPRVELVSVDSMQVYVGMDIGTAKPSTAERAEVRHHLIDMVPPTVDYTVSHFQEAATRAFVEIEGRGGVPVLVGGTGLHLRSIVDALELPGQFPEVVASFEGVPTEELHARLSVLDRVGAKRMEPSNRRRVVRALEVTVGAGRPFSSFGPGLETYPETRFSMVGLRWDRETINGRIEARYDQQMREGFLDEVGRLAALGDELARTPGQALGYRQLLTHVSGGVPLADALGAAMVATRQFARRQERWFRRDPRIRWIDVESNPMEARDAVVGEYEACS